MKLTYKQKMLQKKQDNYQFLRKVEYPPIEEQLDMLYWDMENGGTKWRDTIRNIKTKYPKPGNLTITELPRPQSKRSKAQHKKK
jgi:hypothetical protein